MFTLNSYGNGKVDVYLGEAVYEDCSYTIDGDQVTIDVSSLILTLTIDKDGFVYGNFMGVDVTFGYEDELLDSSKMPD